MRNIFLVNLFLISSLSLAFTISKKSAYIATHSAFSSWGTKTQSAGNIQAFRALENLKIKKIPTVAIIDTGIDPFHQFLISNIYTFRNGKLTRGTTINYGKDFSNAYKGYKATNTPIDNHGHGTHVAGIIKSVFPVARFVPVKFYNEKASGDDNMINLLGALEYAIDNNVDIINYSGGGKAAKKNLMDKERALLKRAKAKGILIVTASGNDGQNIDIVKNHYFPASYRYQNIISVGAYDKNLNLFDRSNYGQNTVHVVAPGKSIASAHIKGAYKMSGTSQATAFVSGVAALLKAAHPELSELQVKELIIKGSTNRSQFAGKSLGGRVNAFQALRLASRN